jgi:predicted  nucleic acid-binding Zn-ribbon protein
MKLVAEISAGELIDKITILRIKLDHIEAPAKRANVRREYDSLTQTLDSAIAPDDEIARLRGELEAVNRELWRIEDEIRDKERTGDFGPEFVALARAVYKTNDLRAELKRRINLVTGSKIVEEKSYAAY